MLPESIDKSVGALGKAFLGRLNAAEQRVVQVEAETADTIAALADKMELIGAVISMSGNQALPISVMTRVNYNTSHIAGQAGWLDPVTNRIKPTVPGTYLVVVTLNYSLTIASGWFTADPVHKYTAELRKNGTLHKKGSHAGYNETKNSATIIYAASMDGVNDYLEVLTRADIPSSGTVALVGGGTTETTISLLRLGDPVL